MFLMCFLSGIATVNSQELKAREEMILIDSILKANPYRDTFLEITFYYTIDITTDKELEVSMDFNGPFKTILKARLMDLGEQFLRDTAYEGKSTICWYCKTDDTIKENRCVYNETITSDLEKESHYSDNICVMFSRDANIRDELKKHFDKLFSLILEQ